MSSSTLQTGTVTQFDRMVGLGEITDGEGRVWPFHCAMLTDGTRNVEVGTAVQFTVRFHVVREEAFEISSL
jgi:cold shock CspA family protein